MAKQELNITFKGVCIELSVGKEEVHITAFDSAHGVSIPIYTPRIHDNEKLYLLTAPIKCLRLSTRARWGLTNAHCRYIGDVVRLQRAQLSKVKNLGRGTLAEIEKFLTEMGLKLAD